LRIALPVDGSFDEVQFSELQREEAEKLLKKYKDDAPAEIEKQKKEEKSSKRTFFYGSSFSARRGFRGGLRGRGGNILRGGMSRGGLYAGRGFVPLPFRGAAAGFPSGPYGQRDIRDVRAARLLNDPRNQAPSTSPSNRPLSIYDHQRSSPSLPPTSLSSSSLSRLPGQDPRFRSPQEGFLPSSTPPYNSFKKQRVTRELSPPPRYSSRPPSPPPTAGLYPPFNPYSRYA